MKFSFSLEGAEKFVENIKTFGEKTRAGAGQAVYAAANAVMTEAKQRAPLDTGVLRASGYVTLPTKGNNPKVEVGFGGAAAAYALVQHERTEFHHEVGEAKFLENAFHAVPVKDIIEKTLRDAVSSGGTPAQVTQGPHRTEPE